MDKGYCLLAVGGNRGGRINMRSRGHDKLMGPSWGSACKSVKDVPGIVHAPEGRKLRKRFTIESEVATVALSDPTSPSAE